MKEIYNKIITFPILRMGFSVLAFSMIWVLMCVFVSKEPNLLTLFYIGLLGGVFGTSLLNKNLTGKEKIQEIAESLYGNNLFLIKTMVGAWLIFWFNANERVPMELFVYEVRQLYLFMAIIPFAILMVKWPVFFLNDGIEGIIDGFRHTAIVVFKGLLFISGTLWAMGMFGDDVYRFVIQNTSDSFVILISCLLTYFLVKVLSKNTNAFVMCKQGVPMSCSVVQMRRPIRRPMSEEDKQIIALHEAGHAAMHAAILKLPETVDVQLFDNPSDGVYGSITGMNTPHWVERKENYEWLMLMLLAGKGSEEFFSVDRSMGSGNDMERWQFLAQEYLSLYPTEKYYYIVPKNSFEEQCNNEQLSNLKKEQEAVVFEFMSKNRTVILAMANQLQQTNLISNKDLKAYLHKIIPVNKMTTIKTNFY